MKFEKSGTLASREKLRLGQIFSRITNDFEKTVESSVNFIQLVFISIILSKF